MPEYNDGCGWAWVKVDTIVNEGETLLHGCVILASAAGGEVQLFDGLDADSGRLIARIKGNANESIPILFYKPLRLDRGLFVDVIASVSGILVFYDPVSNES